MGYRRGHQAFATACDRIEKIKSAKGLSKRIMDVKYLNAFNNLKDIGVLTLEKINEYFKGDFERAWKSPISAFEKAGIKNEELSALGKRGNLNPEKELEKVTSQGIDIIAIGDKNYPGRLKQIPHPPILLYVKGQIKKEDEFAFGIVGTRKITSYGRLVTPAIARELAFAGFTIVSGLATGVDTLAHQAALDAGKRTIAVLGTGLDHNSFFPKQNWKLSEKIAENGAVISEYPLWMGGSKENFPQRNRIISGLSKGVLVVEAAFKSGALITANYALQQNRDVFAVPGPVFSKMSEGANNLIKKGAKLVGSAIDILEEYDIGKTHSAAQRQIKPANKVEAAIITEIKREPAHIDKIITNSKLDVIVVSAALTEMELNGKVKNLGNNTYILNT